MKLAFVFPGQGSQAVGMLADLAAQYPIVGETFTEASDQLGFNLWQMVSEGPKESLNQTINTQPAMLTAGVATWRVWQQQNGLEPSVMAGHSLGEYAALVCSGALDFSEAVKLVAERGRLMQEAVPEGEGAMAAILGLDDDQVRTVCGSAAEGGVVEAVNFNAPGQVVIAGSADAVQRATVLAKEAGANKVYFASAAPAVKYQNLYGIDMPATKELVASNRTDEEVCAEIGADWLIYQDLPDLIASVQEGNTGITEFECSVFTGEYITPLTEGYLENLENSRDDDSKVTRLKTN